MGWAHDGAVTSSSVRTTTMTRVGGSGGVELESATASCVAAVPGLGSDVPGPGATTAVGGAIVEVPVPPAVGSDCIGDRRYEDRVRLWRWLDGWLEEALEGDAGRYGLSGGADPC